MDSSIGFFIHSFILIQPNPVLTHSIASSFHNLFAFPIHHSLNPFPLPKTTATTLRLFKQTPDPHTSPPLSHLPLLLLDPIALLMVDRSLRIGPHRVLKAALQSAPSPLQQPIVHSVVHVLHFQRLSAQFAPQIVRVVHHARARLLFSTLLSSPTRSLSSRTSFRWPSSTQSLCCLYHPRLTFRRSNSSRLRRWFDRCSLYYFRNSRNRPLPPPCESAFRTDRTRSDSSSRD